ncbi:hypothetical protein [Ectobacillus ponti]|uniref:DUF2680 domain-containing protein n=1 Tax=Ectobacillus ponti TaxID=2961894 RepID=A0AA41X108_9BACI|nr:hypothetical protein [Ectobacillus ponti]MCP8966981.1 hypothetical protein [Ectobacillus ponti]
MYQAVMIAAAILLLPVPAAAGVSHQQIEQHFRNQAEQAGIPTAGKELEDIRRALHDWKEAKREETIVQTAERYGISRDGKRMEQVIDEIRTAKEQRLVQAAQQAGIAVDGKNVHELAEELEAHVRAK